MSRTAFSDLSRTLPAMVTQADIDNLNAAIASGARSVTVGGQTLTYNTTASLIQARNDLQAQLAAQNGQRRSKQSYAYQAGRGYHSGC